MSKKDIVDFTKKADKIEKISEKAISSVTNASKLNTALETEDIETLKNIIKDQNKTIKHLQENPVNTKKVDLTSQEEKALAGLNHAVIEYRKVVEERNKADIDVSAYKNVDNIFNQGIASAQMAILNCSIVRKIASKKE